MASNYWQFRSAKVAIAHELMKMGWQVYGYHADNSDLMTDYYDPASWDGIATKNGFVLVVDDKNAYYSARVIKEYNNNTSTSADTQKRIEKLSRMTVDRGCSEEEERSAKEKIEILKSKEGSTNGYKVIGEYPTYQGNPGKCSWHVEKDGTIVAKGMGIGKFSDMENFNNKRNEDEIARYIERGETDSYSYKKCLELRETYKKFSNFLKKVNSAAGVMLGESEESGYIYESVTVTEYKTENKAVQTTEGSVKDGQCFIILSHYFNCGISSGYVYRIKENVDMNGKKYYSARRLNKKLTKELDGYANRANNAFSSIDGKFADKFTKWIESGAIAWCEIQEVKTPYEVQKLVKKPLEQPKKEEKTEEADKPVTTNEYEIKEDVDTRDNSKIYVVKIINTLTKDEYSEERKKMKELGGYYSKFKHGFIFKDDPTSKLNVA